ncbi:hypothetical protein RND81_09G041500 [Saponaria officinalis]|uniref:NADP-dependent oxidoreductase domain-containing protein n=1 Tax=Saponaria officinalis TaxID=3572 RepID=A0AAW1IIG2_SAPOF
MGEILPYTCCKIGPSSIQDKTRRRRDIKAATLRPVSCVATKGERITVVSNGKDSLEMCRVVNGMWQTSGGWVTIDRDNAVTATLKYADAQLATFDMADIYGPAEDLYGLFINRVRRERPPQLLEKMSRSFVEKSIDVSRKRMDVACLDMLQFHWWDYANTGYLDALKHLTDLKDEGKIKTVALTNFDTERLRIILENEIPIVSNQVQHSIVDMRPQQKMAELMMCGLLSEKFLDTNLSIRFAGPSLNTLSAEMVDAWGGWSGKHGVSIATVAPAVAGSMIRVRKIGLEEV